MLKPTGLVSGHYECRSFDESLPILKEFLALEVVDEQDRRKNSSDIRTPAGSSSSMLIGPAAPIKSMRNHYGVRVATNAEVDRATEYLESKKNQFGIKTIKPRENHNAYSVHFTNRAATTGRSSPTNTPSSTAWAKRPTRTGQNLCSTEAFTGSGYVPQALTHGTLENDDLEASEHFYHEALGLEVVKLWPSSCYVKHTDTPWYVVCIQAQNPNRRLSRATSASRSRSTRRRRFMPPIENSPPTEKAGNCARSKTVSESNESVVLSICRLEWQLVGNPAQRLILPGRRHPPHNNSLPMNDVNKAGDAVAQSKLFYGWYIVGVGILVTCGQHVSPFPAR